MKPKDFYKQSNIQEDKRYVFTLIPPEFEKLYKKYIKRPIEEIKLDSGKVTCESDSDLKSTVPDKLDAIWASIQKASIIIANITDFKPGVMFELGAALMKKERVILIAENSPGSAPDFPFNINKLGVEFYDLDNLDIFSRKLVNLVKKIIPTDHILFAPRVSVLMKKALRLRGDRDFDTAFVLFKEMNRIEPKNWYIYKEWAITHEYIKKNEEAISMLKQALEMATTDRQKAEIHTALGVVFRKSKMKEQALESFRQAENLYSDDADLYEKWAFLFHTMGNYQEAMNTMMRAVKLEPDHKSHRWKLEFYSKKFADENFHMGLQDWLSLKKEEEGRTSWFKADLIASPQAIYETGSSVVGEDLRFKFDKKLRSKQYIGKFEKEDESWENIVEMYAQVKDIDDESGFAYLNCKYKKDSGETFKRVFPLKHFKNKYKLKVDQSIIVKVLEKPGEVRFLFEEVDEDFFDRDVEDISVNDPEYSRIFKLL